MTTHPAFDQLSDCADANAPLPGDVSDHVAQCDSCAAQVSALRELRLHTKALPREIRPPADLLAGIRGEIAHHERAASPRANSRPYLLAAAALLIAVLSSLATVSVMRNRTELPSVSRSKVVAATVTSVLPAQLTSTEARYEQSVTSLQRTLAERRDSLAPSTVALVERSLRTADSAIAEARDALARDPGNRALIQLFASNYERKIDLLKRATELTPRT